MTQEIRNKGAIEWTQNRKGNDKRKNTVFKIKMGGNVENNTNSWHFDETMKLLNTWQDLSIKEQSPIKYSAIRKFIKKWQTLGK